MSESMSCFIVTVGTHAIDVFVCTTRENMETLIDLVTTAKGTKGRKITV